MRRRVGLVVVNAVSVLFFVVQAAFLVVVWTVAAPLAFALGVAGWVAIRRTPEENFVWGERVLQRARCASERLAQTGWRVLDALGRAFD